MAAFACLLYRFGPVIHVPASRLNLPMNRPSFSHVAVQRRMICFVHRDLEAANGPFGHAALAD
jgi:hypothetical protein